MHYVGAVTEALLSFPRGPRHPFAPSSAWFELPLHQLYSSFENFSYDDRILLLNISVMSSM